MSPALSDELCAKSAVELLALYRDKAVSPVEVVRAHLARIHEHDGDVGAFISVLDDQAEQAARTAEQAWRSRTAEALCGVPVAVKDSEALIGARTTYGIRALANHSEEVNSAPVDRLLAAGAVVVGKTNLPPFGYSAVTDNDLVGPTSTPFQLGSNSGGSSGGSAAAVAAHFAPVAIGSDGGGSVRIPAALCGVVSFKATFGRLPYGAGTAGAFDTHSPFAHPGPLARTVEDTMLMLRVMAGVDARDPFSVPAEPSFAIDLDDDVRELHIAYCPNLSDFPVAVDVADVVGNTARQLATAGANVEEKEVDFGASCGELAAYWRRLTSLGTWAAIVRLRDIGIDLLADPESGLAPFFWEDIKGLHELRAADLKLQDRLRTNVLEAIEQLLVDHDLIITPTTTVASVPNGARGQTIGPEAVNGMPVDPLIGWVLAFPLNFTGHPAVSVPAGMTPTGHPVGVQLIGRRFAENTLLRACRYIERSRPWNESYPTLEPSTTTEPRRMPRSEARGD
jgi:Asp-tRNA(Asn)/Glu-tRNA(Gln) amidotransferase A subunit family amidase